MCHASMPWQTLLVGAWANSQGQGILQLQMSNQSPASRHCGTVFMQCLVSSNDNQEDGTVSAKNRHGGYSIPEATTPVCARQCPHDSSSWSDYPLAERTARSDQASERAVSCATA